MSAETQCSLSESRPDLWHINGLGRLESDIEVPTLDGKIKACCLVLYKVQCNFREALFLQIRNDGLTHKAGRADDAKHLIIATLQEGELELVLGRINSHRPRACLAIQAVHSRTLHTRQVEWLLQCFYDADIALWQSILYMVQRAIQQHAIRVPGSALDPDRLVNQM